jgi:hypothetical protein
MTDLDLTLLAGDGAFPSEHDRTLAKAADELHADSRLSDSTWAFLANVYSESQLIELLFLVGQYHVVSFLLNSLRVQREPGVPGLPEIIQRAERSETR